MRVTDKRRTIGMVGSQENAPRVINQQEGLQVLLPCKALTNLIFILNGTTPQPHRIHIHRHPFIGAWRVYDWHADACCRRMP